MFVFVGIGEYDFVEVVECEGYVARTGGYARGGDGEEKGFLGGTEEREGGENGGSGCGADCGGAH